MIPKRIDYIFLGASSSLKSRDVSLLSSRVVMKKIIQGVQASDHYGVFAEVQIDQ
jgi:endonuclease/exonuclease/phosphatase family metal-dependent hydrolase